MKSVSHSIPLAIVSSLMCVLFGAGYAGCNGTTDTGEAVPGHAFKIKYGQELTVKGEDLKVKFASVEDGRCPTGVNCFVGGDATVLISVRRADVEESQIELHTYPPQGGKSQRGKYQQYGILLVALDPYPRIDVETKRSDYVATLLIKKE